jgi:hypothetical protein
MHFRILSAFPRISLFEKEFKNKKNSRTVAGRLLPQGHGRPARPCGLGGPGCRRGARDVHGRAVTAPRPMRWRGNQRRCRAQIRVPF